MEALVEVAGVLRTSARAPRIAARSALSARPLLHAAHVALLAKQEAWPELVKAGESALFVDPANPALHVHLGRAYLGIGRAADGLTELDRALALGHPEVGPIQLARARALSALRRRGQARAAVRAALEADPELKDEAQSLLRTL